MRKFCAKLQVIWSHTGDFWGFLAIWSFLGFWDLPFQNYSLAVGQPVIQLKRDKAHILKKKVWHLLVSNGIFIAFELTLLWGFKAIGDLYIFSTGKFWPWNAAKTDWMVWTKVKISL